jgi:hypothetical protein
LENRQEISYSPVKKNPDNLCPNNFRLGGLSSINSAIFLPVQIQIHCARFAAAGGRNFSVQGMAANVFLIIDDHPIFSRALVTLLGDAFPDSEFLTAGTLDEGKQLLLSSDPPPIVLLDINLPDARAPMAPAN